MKINDDFQISFDQTQIHARNLKHATVMLSGGIDSCVALWWSLDNYANVKVFSVDYNQPHIIELEYANLLTNLTNVFYKKIKIDIPGDFWGIEHRLTRGQACLMTSIAALDISHDGSDLVMGILNSDSIYGDCNRGFLDKLASVLDHPDDQGLIGIATPLRAVYDKSDVIALGYKLGAPMTYTLTCRNPINNKPCHNCVQCRLREKAFKEFYDKYSVSEAVFTSWNSILGSPCHPRVRNIPDKYKASIQAFIEAGGLTNCESSYLYNAPDGTKRISTKIKSVPDSFVSAENSIIQSLGIHGYFDDGYRWEMCLCKDGTFVSTDRLPDSSIIEKELMKKAKLLL